MHYSIVFLREYRIMVAVISLVTLSTIILNALATQTSAQNDKIETFPIGSKPYNSTYGEWSVKWWIWALSIPEENNPVTDQTGENCDINQEGQVWNLAGTTGGSVTRQCDVPVGKAIFLSPLNIECSYAEFPTMKTEQELRDCAQWPGASIEVTVDGVKIDDIDKYNVQSPIFDVDLPENNIFGAPAGPTKAVSGGWWVMLKPLPPGNHQISFGGSVLDNPTTGTQSFAVESTYNLNVG